jgi:phenylalanyl-tRNA synthetase alpha chain
MTTTEACEVAILGHLAASENAVIGDTYEFATSRSLDPQIVIGAVNSLMRERYVASEELKTEFYTLSAEAQEILEKGSHEVVVLKAIQGTENGRLSLTDLQSLVGNAVAKIGMANCMKNKWIQKDGTDLVAVANIQKVADVTRDALQKIVSGNYAKDSIDEKVCTYHNILEMVRLLQCSILLIQSNLILLSLQMVSQLKKRKLVNLVTRKSLRVKRGTSFAPQRVKRAADLTKEMIDSGAWKTTPFKPYNFLTVGQPVGGGYLHPLLKVRAEFRKILLEMGFSEMPTNKWVESSFWNFDSLFQPQSHPARDAHDTFFIKYPAETISVPEDYYERVKEMHERGGAGSIGYRYDFQRAEAMKNLLRTHTTAISSQMLYQLAKQPGGFQPAKFFSIDRVFRNETMDATHLCEFHQVEGLVADYDLSLGDLIGIIETFFKKIGITQLRFKPAFNPYTEVRLLVFEQHETWHSICKQKITITQKL